ncbi:MAG: hypothetical protein K8T91_20180 [Planctomycetes bacterium]|nr:hypothetical protein [Planctomycetota bacterium]
MSSFIRFLGAILGLENVESIQQIRPSFTESWASSAPFWVFCAAAVLAAVGVVTYYRFEPAARGRSRLALAILRGVTLALLVIILAGPALTIVFTNEPKPLMYLLFDGSDSMAIRDNLGDEQQQKLMAAVELKPSADKASAEPPRRVDYVQALLKKQDQNLVRRLGEKYRLRAFLFDRRDGVRGMALSKSVTETELDPALLADDLTTSGDVTALGSALEDLALRHKKSQLAGVVAFGDFAWNSGPSPIGSEQSPVARLGVPVYTVGVGPEAALDLRVELAAETTTKKGERISIGVKLSQSQLDGQTAKVRLTAVPRKAGGTPSSDVGGIRVGERSVRLDKAETMVDFPFEPQESGRYELVAEVEPISGEQVEENNKARRDLTVTDDFLRLLFVANEPSWEWRFVKEVFHRDKLVGTRGFRTFLRSSDPEVRRANPLFIPSLDMERSEFFANDVLFLGDMPQLALSPAYCDWVKEYVDKFGGGLVILAGAVHGVGELSNTPLADLLPVSVESGEPIRAKEAFRPRLTPAATNYEFMQLGATPEENTAAWDNLGQLNWYQPATKRHFQAEVLAEHPTDKMANGEPQPLIAVRPYGKGQVVYLAFDEMWRLRRRYGEQYYRQFWGQLIHRLGLKHAVGSQKRFVPRTLSRYSEGEDVQLTVEAFDENFRPLPADRVAGRKLQAKLFPPSGTGGVGQPQELSVPFSRPGVFETQVPLVGGGEYRVLVTDPLTKTESEVRFQVEQRSAERQSAVRNVMLQKQIADQSGGRPYDLLTVGKLPDEISVKALVETTTKTVPLLSAWWATLLCLLVLVGLASAEWIIRKLVRLP